MNTTMSAAVRNLVMMLATQSPIILAYLLGCIVVIARWRSLGRAALPAFLGFGLMLFVAVIFPMIWAVLPQMLQGTPAMSMANAYTVVNFVRGLIVAVGVVLLLLGITLGRSPTSSRMG